MKKAIFSLIMMVFLLCTVISIGSAEQSTMVGQEIEFGRYEQDNIQNGQEPIEWIVISANNEDGTITVVSKYLLDCIVYNEKVKKTAWQDSYIHNWLNSTFYDAAFSPDEKAAIVPTVVSKSTDQVFMLNTEQINTLLPTELCEATAYAKSRGVYVADDVSTSSWWVRADSTNKMATFVGAHGKIYKERNMVTMTDNGVRPAITINLSYLAGEMPSPELTIGESITINGLGLFSAKQVRVLDRIGYFAEGNHGETESDFTLFYDSTSEAEFIILKADIENNTDEEIDYLQDTEVVVQMENEDRYKGWKYQYNYTNRCSATTYINEEDADRQNENYVIQHSDDFSIRPGDSGHYCFGCTLPNDALEAGTGITMMISIDGREIAISIR